MSYQTLYHEVSISKDQLFDLLLGQGNLLLRLYGQKPIILKEFSGRHGVCEEGGITIHEAKIRGESEDSNLSYVDGKVTIAAIQNNEVYMCNLKLHLQNHFE